MDVFIEGIGGLLAPNNHGLYYESQKLKEYEID
jgi:hypothetical protein